MVLSVYFSFIFKIIHLADGSRESLADFHLIAPTQIRPVYLTVPVSIVISVHISAEINGVIHNTEALYTV